MINDNQRFFLMYISKLIPKSPKIQQSLWNPDSDHEHKAGGDPVVELLAQISPVTMDGTSRAVQINIGELTASKQSSRLTMPSLDGTKLLSLAS